MQKLDRLGWAAGFSFKLHGVRIGIRANGESCLNSALKCLPPSWQIASSPVVDRIYSIIGADNSKRFGRGFNLLYGDHLQLVRSRDQGVLFRTLETDLRLYIAETTKKRIFVHAGVVGWRDKAIVIPGRSFSGKSTLVAEFVKVGASYYSDEYAVIDARGCVHPFLKPLELRDQGDTRQTKVSISDLGGQAGTRALPVSLVLVTRFREGAAWRPRKLSPGQGVLELLANTVSARRQPEQAMAALQKVVTTATILKGIRGHAPNLVSTLLELGEHGTKVKSRK